MNTIFVTGADKGLGYCLVDIFARHGFRVFAGLLGDGAAVAKLTIAHQGRVVPVPQDVTDMESIKRSAEGVRKLTDRLDILMNVAGIGFADMRRGLDATDLDNGLSEKMMAVNAFGPLRVTQAFLPLLERGSLKKVATVSSEAGSIGECQREGDYPYCMSKAAVNMFSKILQNALKAKGFKVLVFQPGWMRTDMGGPTADITPETSAAGIYELTMRQWSVDDPMYMSYTGEVLQW